MDVHTTKRPPAGGIRYNRTAEISERIRVSSPYGVKIQNNGQHTIDSKSYDRIKQSLLQVELLLNRAMQLPPEKAYLDLNELQVLIKEFLEQVHELSLVMQPTILNSLGLLPVLLWYFESYKTKTNIPVNFKHCGLGRNFTPEISNATYHIVKEALANSLSSTTADEVSVQIWVEKEVLNICIGNYHISSAPAAASVTPANVGSIAEQVLALDGKLVIDSSSGSDTRLVVELPLVKPTTPSYSLLS